MAYFLAVDAGGTKTDFVLADERHILARQRTGTIKRLRTDTDTALHTLEAALHELSRKAGIPLTCILRTCIGAADETVPLVAEWLRQTFAERVGGNLLLLGDVEIALDAAFRGGPGVLVLAGTGSNVAGRTRSGKRATCGGWGPMLADQGSGQGIGARALRRNKRARQRPLRRRRPRQADQRSRHTESQWSGPRGYPILWQWRGSIG